MLLRTACYAARQADARQSRRWTRRSRSFKRKRSTRTEEWDGFRCIVFRDGDEVELGSRNERPLTRYFPEVVDAVREQMPGGAWSTARSSSPADRLDFEALLKRIHPAESRVNKLAAETPAGFVAFDLLALGDDDLTSRSFGERRELLEKSLAQGLGLDLPHARHRRQHEGAQLVRGLRGRGAGRGDRQAARLAVPAKTERVMFKVKHLRTADCVVAGFRWHTSGPVVGSLLLGLWDDDGHLQHVGVCGAFTAARRKELVDELEPLRANALEGHPWSRGSRRTTIEDRRPGAVSRWNAKKDLSWVPLRPELVVEVTS